MQETTFNSPYQANGTAINASIHQWLGVIYSEALQKENLLSVATFAQFSSIINLQKSIQYSFIKNELLIQALTQSTFCYEFNQLNLTPIFSNERLEFLGDSLVNLIMAKILFKKFPKSPEGELSKLRGALVNENSLASLAEVLSLDENIFLGKGEYKNAGNKKESLLADAFEALCAAIYLDSNESLETLEKTLLVIINKFEIVSGKPFFSLNHLESFDSKSQLQELTVALFQMRPEYKSQVSNVGEFLVELWIGERKLAEGFGPSKKKLEKELARVVLDEKRYL